MGKHQAPRAAKIAEPILAKHAREEFGVGWKWLRARVESGEIRSQKVGRYLVLDRGDVERLAPKGMELVEQALRDRARRRNK
jgi:hypothetical protein